MFINTAYAQSATPGPLESLTSGGMWIFFVVFAFMYFAIIRPEQKKAKQRAQEQKDMMEALGKGDEVVTSGGILGKVTKVTDAYVTLEIANGTEIIVQKPAIVSLLLKGTIKSI